MTLLMKEKFDFTRGKEEGIELGEIRGLVKTARNMLSKFDDATIADVTRLSLEKIAILREEEGK